MALSEIIKQQKQEIEDNNDSVRTEVIKFNKDHET